MIGVKGLISGARTTILTFMVMIVFRTMVELSSLLAKLSGWLAGQSRAVLIALVICLVKSFVKVVVIGMVRNRFTSGSSVSEFYDSVRLRGIVLT